MKPIYIGKKSTRVSKFFTYFFGALLVLICLARMTAPTLIKSKINKNGSDKNGYAFSVEDIELSVFKGNVIVSGIKVVHPESKKVLTNLSEVEADFSWLNLMSNNKKISLHAPKVDIVLTKDLVQEVKRVRTKTKKNFQDKKLKSVHLDELNLSIDEFHLKNHDSKTLLSLSDIEMDFHDLGLGAKAENTEFKMKSKIAEGGDLKLEGAVNASDENLPWKINGSFKDISGKVFEKLAGGELPVKIEEGEFNADISAQSHNGQIDGVIKPILENVSIKEKDNGVLNRAVAKAANYLFQKSKGKDDLLSFELPFSIGENLVIDVPRTMDKIRK